MADGRESAHVDPELSDQHLGCRLLDAGYGLQACDRVSKRVEQDLQLGVNRSDGLLDRGHLSKVEFEMQPVIGSDPTSKRLDEPFTRGAQARIAQLDQLLWIRLSSDESAQDALPLLPIRSLIALVTLMFASSSVLYDAARAAFLPHELLAGPRQSSQILDWLRRDEAPLMSPCAKRSLSHVASLTSVLRPGTFFTCMGLASNSSNEPSRTCHTGFQYTPALPSRCACTAVGSTSPKERVARSSSSQMCVRRG